MPLCVAASIIALFSLVSNSRMFLFLSHLLPNLSRCQCFYLGSWISLPLFEILVCVLYSWFLILSVFFSVCTFLFLYSFKNHGLLFLSSGCNSLHLFQSPSIGQLSNVLYNFLCHFFCPHHMWYWIRWLHHSSILHFFLS